jgi:hypothetical protein
LGSPDIIVFIDRWPCGRGLDASDKAIQVPCAEKSFGHFEPVLNFLAKPMYYMDKNVFLPNVSTAARGQHKSLQM